MPQPSEQTRSGEQLSFMIGEVRVDQNGKIFRLTYPDYGSTYLIDVTDESDPTTAEEDTPELAENVHDLMSRELNDAQYEGVYGHNNGIIALVTNQLDSASRTRVYLGMTMVNPEDPERLDITTHILAKAGFVDQSAVGGLSFYVPFALDSEYAADYIRQLIIKAGSKQDAAQNTHSPLALDRGTSVLNELSINERGETIDPNSKLNLSQIGDLIYKYYHQIYPQIVKDCLVHKPESGHLLVRDELNMRTYEYMENGNLLRVTLFLGPSTQDVHEYGNYPRIYFEFRRIKGSNEYRPHDAQIGIRGHTVGLAYIQTLRGQGQTRTFLVDEENEVTIGDLMRQLQDYLPPQTD